MADTATDNERRMASALNAKRAAGESSNAAWAWTLSKTRYLRAKLSQGARYIWGSRAVRALTSQLTKVRTWIAAGAVAVGPIGMVSGSIAVATSSAGRNLIGKALGLVRKVAGTVGTLALKAYAYTLCKLPYVGKYFDRLAQWTTKQVFKAQLKLAGSTKLATFTGWFHPTRKWVRVTNQAATLITALLLAGKFIPTPFGPAVVAVLSIVGVLRLALEVLSIDWATRGREVVIESVNGSSSLTDDELVDLVTVTPETYAAAQKIVEAQSLADIGRGVGLFDEAWMDLAERNANGQGHGTTIVAVVVDAAAAIAYQSAAAKAELAGEPLDRYTYEQFGLGNPIIKQHLEDDVTSATEAIATRIQDHFDRNRVKGQGKKSKSQHLNILRPSVKDLYEKILLDSVSDNAANNLVADVYEAYLSTWSMPSNRLTREQIFQEIQKRAAKQWLMKAGEGARFYVPEEGEYIAG